MMKVIKLNFLFYKMMLQVAAMHNVGATSPVVLINLCLLCLFYARLEFGLWSKLGLVRVTIRPAF